MLAVAGGGQARAIKEGGTFRLGIPSVAVDSFDAALSNTPGPLVVLEATCAGVMRFPDTPSTEFTSVVPEIAAADPVVSSDGKTYTFTIRQGLRFSTGTPVTALDVAHTINRLLSKTMQSPVAVLFSDIVGAQAVIDGKASSAS